MAAARSGSAETTRRICYCSFLVRRFKGLALLSATIITVLPRALSLRLRTTLALRNKRWKKF
jgi:hypothetical protein